MNTSTPLKPEILEAVKLYLERKPYKEVKDWLSKLEDNNLLLSDKIAISNYMVGAEKTIRTHWELFTSVQTEIQEVAARNLEATKKDDWVETNSVEEVEQK
jgi:hypothetical protein